MYLWLRLGVGWQLGETSTRAATEDRFLTSDDRITVEADGDQTLVTYQADLTLNGVLGLADPLLRLAFGRIGDRAAVGLRTALGGVEVT